MELNLTRCHGRSVIILLILEYIFVAVSLLYMNGNRGIVVIAQNTAEFLRGVNNIRNRLSHKLGTPITFDEAFKLAGLAAAGGVDFCDSTIYLNKSRSLHEYGIEGVIQEVFQNAALDLLYLMDDKSFLENFVSVRNS